VTRGVPFRGRGRIAAPAAPLSVAHAGGRSFGPSAAIVGTTLLVLLLAGAQGGYFPPSWGWTALALAWVIGLWAIVGGRYELGRLDAAMLGALSALLLWIVGSAVWSDDAAQSLLEAQRGLVYVTGLGAFLLLGRRHTVPALSAAIAAAISLEALYALATRLFPDRLGGFDPVAVYRLSGSIGYWNGLGIFCVMGILLAIGLALHERRPVRIGAAVALVVLLPALYFTFSRGAWIALGIGAAAIFVVARQRLRIVTAALIVLPVPVIAVLIGSRADALTHEGALRAAAVDEGHRLAWILFGLIVVQLVVILGFALLEPRVRPGRTLKRAFGGALVAAALVAASLVVVRLGGPVELVSKGYAAFKAPPPSVRGDLNERLLSFSGNGRADLWAAAWDDYREHQILGSGAGSYERFWLQTRETPLKVRDAHGLYVETLAELGPIGLALLLGTLAVPVVAFWRSSRGSIVAGGLGAYAAFLVHAGVDWDWELSAVTLAGLLCGGVIVLAARGGFERDLRPFPRAGILVAALAAGSFALVGLLGNSALAEAEDAVEAGRWQNAATAAARAERWMPWSARPWVVGGEARLGSGDTAGARMSFRKAVALDPNDWRAWSELAVAETGSARSRAIRRARALNPLEPSVVSLRSSTGSG